MTLYSIAIKASALKVLEIQKMSAASEAVKHALATFVATVISRSPPLDDLSLQNNNFESRDIEAIQGALSNSNIRSLTYLYLIGNPAIVDSDRKCLAWADVLKK